MYKVQVGLLSDNRR